MKNTRKITDTFTLSDGVKLIINNIPAIIDTENSEVIGYTVSVVSKLEKIKKYAKNRDIKEIEFDVVLENEDKNINQIGLELKRKMSEKGMTGVRMARALGVTPPLVSKWLRDGYNDYNIDTLRRMANILDMDLEINFKDR